MNKPRIFSIFFLVLLTILLAGCLENNVIETETAEASITEKVLQRIETNDNYISSEDFPALITADDLISNLRSYIVIDVRSEAEYSNGHIQGSVNIKNDQLFEYVDERKDQQIVLVSLTGQEASYYTSLFRIYGIENIYALRFGFAVWNTDFSDVWLNNAADKFITYNSQITNEEPPKNPLTDLPTLLNDDLSSDSREVLKERIKFLMQQGFNDNQMGVLTEKTVDLDGLFNIPNSYVICSGDISLYNMNGVGHLEGSTFYITLPPNRSNFKSISFLQTLPTDRQIFIYSYSGQISAMLSAYLSTIGYDARSILFGAHNIFNSLMDTIDVDFQFSVFFTSELRNFNYERN